MEVNQTNNTLYYTDKKLRDPVKTLDKNAFLQIMVAQLRYQDPTNAMDNSKFIEQMAQFTSLEQMTNLNTNIEKLYTLQQFNQASFLIGFKVTLQNGEQLLTGTVEKATMGENGVKIWVAGNPYTLEQVTAVERGTPDESK
ncbi:flagellar hook capping FlgD N-terminal domain-containing protein [Desulforamulus putei]|uniref:Flagellar basal-body rod modification protein FlgD n=1 Tax=Desulforamulus putei DSM 12395 TaxID=1121429 RepID=A0A1M5B422_9FIRM|nr:flagellar hook capping FlgD N-terminal domain-containing protein [Desulforamulus putei]SHF37209.1 flagellar basal-body rod modification protein FlgD [Desulforamulus putei DSM 12395]